jgi:hypothetical protein
MPISDRKLPLEGNVELIDKMTEDYGHMVASGASKFPSKRFYKISYTEEPDIISRSARKAALSNLLAPKLTKIAIDTRRINQEEIRNPRTNMQNWHRSDLFVNDNVQDKLDVFGKVKECLVEIKEVYGKQPEYLTSYAAELDGHVDRALRLNIGDKDYFEPQLAYLEQLLFARYRLSMDEIKRIEKRDIKKAILSKDEDLLKRGAYIDRTGGFSKVSEDPHKIVINGNGAGTQQNIIEAIFGNNNIRRDGEKKVQRTITITVTDEVKDD